MQLWSGAVLKLDGHPDHNKGPDLTPCALILKILDPSSTNCCNDYLKP